jgi:hypothetical protein
MKKRLNIPAALFAMAVVFIYSCWDGEKNGRRYRLQDTCLRGHSQMFMTTVLIGKNFVPQWHYVYICDSSRIDTVWEKLEDTDQITN